MPSEKIIDAIHSKWFNNAWNHDQNVSFDWDE